MSRTYDLVRTELPVKEGHRGRKPCEWRVDGSRPRRYYILNETGRNVLGDLSAVWREQEKVIRRILDENERIST